MKDLGELEQATRLKLLVNLLEGVIAEYQHDPNTLSIVLIGSGSRGELDVFSDLDIHIVVRGERPADRMFYRENRLVIINFVDKENRESMLTDPWKAIWNIAAAREAQIFFDPDGWYADLRRRAETFTWKLVSKDADIAVSWVLAENAEIAQKILSGLSRNDLEKTLNATVYLLQNLTSVAALANGVLCNSENRFWRMVRDNEPDSEWKTLYWTALGLASESVTLRAESVLRLYSRSAVLYRQKLLPEHLPIIEHVCNLISDNIQTSVATQPNQ